MIPQVGQLVKYCEHKDDYFYGYIEEVCLDTHRCLLSVRWLDNNEVSYVSYPSISYDLELL